MDKGKALGQTYGYEMDRHTPRLVAFRRRVDVVDCRAATDGVGFGWANH